MEETTAFTAATSSWQSRMSTHANATVALAELLGGVDPRNSTAAVAFLFVGPYHSQSFCALVEQASEALPGCRVLSVVGGGVISDAGGELEEATTPCMSLLLGDDAAVPLGTTLQAWDFNTLKSPPPPPEDDAFWSQFHRSAADRHSSSFLVFADPWSPLDDVVAGLGPSAVIAGGVSVPTGVGPTVALDGHALPQGSMVLLRWPGPLQVITSQGCTPVPSSSQQQQQRIYTVTACRSNIIQELDGEPSSDVWNRVLKSICSPSARTSVVCGIRARKRHATTAKGDDDYLIRQVLGCSRNGLVVAGRRLQVGDQIMFHVRDKHTARKDMEDRMQRGRLGQLLQPNHRPVAALQISCVARGRGLFARPNVDLELTQRILRPPVVAGFFANGELGPVGLAGFGRDPGECETFLHGFSTVIALLCVEDEEDRQLPVLGSAWE